MNMKNGASTNPQAILLDHWRSHAEKTPDRIAVVHWVAGEDPFRWNWKHLMGASFRYAVRLRKLGVGKGDVCAIIIRHHKNFYPIYIAVSFLGALPSVLAYPNQRLHPEKFRDGLEGMARRSGLDWLLTERELEASVRPCVSRPGSTIRGIIFPLEWRDDEEADEVFPQLKESLPDDPCLLQHSSGTTGLQKAVILSHRAVLEHVLRYGESIGVTPEDKIVSWLPLYHDMGLIAAFYLPLTLGIPVIQIDPFEWVSAPILLMEAISQEKGTLAWLPNFAYNLMADRIHDEDLTDLRFDSVRMLINCSEPVRAESHEKFFRKFHSLGIRREVLAACYAMAETTFAATQTAPGLESRKVFVDREALAQGRVQIVEGDKGARVCVSSGTPISGCEMRIINESGDVLSEGSVGEIAIRSVSLFDGYRNNPEKTDEVLKGDWYFSGDYGFLHQGEYYVIGRKKDIIIIAGNNIYPEDIEDAVSKIPDVIPGRVISFGIEDERSGTEQVCVIAESKVENEAEKKRVRLAIREVGMGIDVTIGRVYLAPPRWLIKSSSGKPSRNANKERALRELPWK
jgi:acyl-CoA synthetase (AMP-forming)/AMP-acid ligase II